MELAQVVQLSVTSLSYIGIYLCTGCLYWIISAFIAGLNREEITISEYKTALFWPVYLANVMGLVIQGIYRSAVNGK